MTLSARLPKNTPLSIITLIPTMLKYLCINHRDQKIFFQFEIFKTVLDSFILWVWVRYKENHSFSAEIVFRRQTRTYSDGPRAERVNNHILKLGATEGGIIIATFFIFNYYSMHTSKLAYLFIHFVIYSL